MSCIDSFLYLSREKEYEPITLPHKESHMLRETVCSMYPSLPVESEWKRSTQFKTGRRIAMMIDPTNANV